MTNLPTPFFLLGAGFGADAGKLVGEIEAESIYVGKYRFTCEYPLVRDLPSICFPDRRVPIENVEECLARALTDGDSSPFDRLSEALSKADHHLAPRLVGWPKAPNPYQTFFSDFPESSFATYNYDAFVEFALFRSGRWSPHDGFGVRVAVAVGFTAEPFDFRDSSCLVLHLHGTYMVYEYNHSFGPEDAHGVRWLQPFDTPRFAFDPHSIGSGFYPFERFMAGLSYNPDVQSRVVAPIPDKSTGLKGAFIQEVTKRAKELAVNSRLVIAIGYAFSPHDSASFDGLLEAINSAAASRVIIVSPDATRTAERLRPHYPKIEWVSIDLGFASWVTEGYPGIDRSV